MCFNVRMATFSISGLEDWRQQVGNDLQHFSSFNHRRRISAHITQSKECPSLACSGGCSVQPRTQAARSAPVAAASLSTLGRQQFFWDWPSPGCRDPPFTSHSFPFCFPAAPGPLSNHPHGLGPLPLLHTQTPQPPVCGLHKYHSGDEFNHPYPSTRPRPPTASQPSSGRLRQPGGVCTVDRRKTPEPRGLLWGEIFSAPGGNILGAPAPGNSRLSSGLR